MRTYLFLAIAGVVVLLAVILITCRAEWQPTPIVVATATAPPRLSVPPTETPLASPDPPTPSSTAIVLPRPTNTSTPDPTPTPTLTTEERLLQAELPVRDLNKLALKFKGAAKSGPEISVPPANNFSLGDLDMFWVSDTTLQDPRQFQVTARLVYMTDHAYWWVQEGFSVPEADLIASAEQFENYTYPTTRSYFGSEWSPGVDNDVRIHILMGDIPGVGGYYASSNEYSLFAEEYSNQREMFLVNLKAIQPGNDRFDGVLAHEFQHMIHWYQDPNEDTWLNEGLSELAQYLNGYDLSSFTDVYLEQPDIQLTAWGLEARTTGVDYGYSFLFSAYFLDKFGPEAVRQLVTHPGNGVTGIERTLQEMGKGLTFDEIFADFIIANYLNDPRLDTGQWGYTLSGFDLPVPSASAQHTTFPIKVSETVNQYGVDYIELISPAETTPTDLMITFDGSTTVALLNNEPRSGRYQWYSNRGDAIDTTLTRAFDLGDLSRATFKFWAWYDIEANWDYAYLTLSTDNGQTWQILPATTTTEANPVGNAYGPGFTGVSGTSPQWLEETADLTPYVGQEVLLRFEYITDDAVNLPGFAIDDISIPELGYFDDAEADGGWVSEGFIRPDNVLLQHFIVQIIEFGPQGQVTVRRMPLDLKNRGDYVMQGFGQEIQRAVLVISARSPVTTNPASYTYTIEP